MRFLTILFWTFLALVVLVFAGRNWSDVTLILWRDLRLDIKLPFLLVVLVLATWLSTWLAMRGQVWRLRRRVMQLEHPLANPPAPEAATIDAETEE